MAAILEKQQRSDVSERLASLGVMGEQLRAPWNSSKRHIKWFKYGGMSLIGPALYRETLVFQTAVVSLFSLEWLHLKPVLFNGEKISPSLSALCMFYAPANDTMLPMTQWKVAND